MRHLIASVVVAMCVHVVALAGPFDKLDEHALNAKPADEKTLTSLAKYLTKDCKTDTEKARVIFRWITDRITYVEGKGVDGKGIALKPEEVLASRKTNYTGNTYLFVALATRAKLSANEVYGHVKLPGGGKPFAHRWVAAKIDKEWKLIDATWGSGKEVGGAFQKQLNEAYFFADPEMLILTHFPADSKWQLLKKPITQTEFEKRPAIPGDLLALGVDVKKVVEAAQAKGGLVTVHGLQGNARVKVENAPLVKVLESGKEYEFAFSTADFDRVLLLYENNTIFEFTKSEDTFSGKTSPPKGWVKVVLSKKGTNNGAVILQYQCE